MLHGTISAYTNHRCRCDSCRASWRAHQRKTRNQTYDREAARRRYAARIAYAREQLGGRCVECGSTGDLQFDHIDRATKTGNIADLCKGPLGPLDAELLKCQLLCGSCHRTKTIAENRAAEAHGTAAQYWRGCRCDTCRHAGSVYNRERAAIRSS